ncbi:MAG: hypothetical protein GY815_13035 [Gammaproteobacteria bacterium]|nr:hypothetical protein [Gammaproteobacteria bacterium]
MGDIYAAPESGVVQINRGESAGGNVDDAIAGNIEVNMLETLGDAWRGLKGFKLKCLIASLIWFVAYVVVSMVSYPVTRGIMLMGADAMSASIISVIVQSAVVAAVMPMWVGICIMGIRHSQGKSVSSGCIFEYFHRIPGAILWYFLMSFLIMLGYLLLIVPGIYLSFAYMFSLTLMIEKNMSAWQALEVSRKAVTRIWFRATGFLLLIALLVILGTIVLVIPLIWILPWVTLAFAMLYFKLFGAEAETLAD